MLTTNYVALHYAVFSILLSYPVIHTQYFPQHTFSDSVYTLLLDRYQGSVRKKISILIKIKHAKSSNIKCRIEMARHVMFSITVLFFNLTSHRGACTNICTKLLVYMIHSACDRPVL
jgi:hypothetical protein